MTGDVRKFESGKRNLRSEAKEPKPEKLPAASVYEFGPYQLDLSRYELRRGGARLRVAPAPMDLLILFIERPGALISREEIAARLWTTPDMVDVDQGINTAVRRIREVLRDDPLKPRFIQTVVGRGYRFIAEVREVKPDLLLAASPVSPPASKKLESVGKSSDSAGLIRPAEPLNNPAIKSKFRRKHAGLLVSIAILVALGIGYADWRQQKRRAARDTSSLEQITTNDSEQRVTAAAISPDGKWIAFTDTQGITLRLLQSGKTVQLKGPGAFRADCIAWFPDQTRILVSGFDNQFADPRIWTVFITGTSPQLFRHNAHHGIPSPDGTRIAFTATKDRELWIAGANGEGSHPLIVDPSGGTFSALFWSGDGKRVSFLRSANGLGNEDYESADATSGKVLAIEKNVTFESSYALQDGRVFFLRDSPARVRDAYSLWQVNTNPSNGSFVSSPTRIAPLDKAKAFGLTGSDDGSRMSVVLQRGQPHVYVGRLQQPGPTLGQVQRLTYDTRVDYPGSWLHDNQTVLFESNRVGAYRLYKQRLQDHTPQELDTGPGPAVLPQVTPDGKWVLYAGNPDVTSSPRSRLFRIPVGGGTPEQVAIGGPLDEFRCPLIGRSNCVLRETEGKKALVYYALDPLTGKGREIARTSWLPHVTTDWCVSPDGSAVALTAHEAGNPRIRIVPLNAGSVHHERELAVSGFGMLSGISWSADGKGWYVAADTAAGTLILFVNQRGESHVLRDMPLSSWGVPSPDGSKLAFVDQVVDSNVWMWQIEAHR